MSRLLAAAAALTLVAASAHAQLPTPKQVLSVNPLLALAGYYTGEYERTLSPSVTLGLGASYWTDEEESDLSSVRVSYLATDLKLRYYPQGRALTGFSLALTGGYGNVTDRKTFTADGSRLKNTHDAVTLGTQLDYSWLLGAQRNFAVGLGIGAKRFFALEENAGDDVDPVIPTARVSVGLAF